MKTDPATLKRVYAMSLAGVYPHYIAKAEKKGRTKAEVDQMLANAQMRPRPNV